MTFLFAFALGLLSPSAEAGYSMNVKPFTMKILDVDGIPVAGFPVWVHQGVETWQLLPNSDGGPTPELGWDYDLKGNSAKAYYVTGTDGTVSVPGAKDWSPSPVKRNRQISFQFGYLEACPNGRGINFFGAPFVSDLNAEISCEYGLGREPSESADLLWYATFSDKIFNAQAKPIVCRSHVSTAKLLKLRKDGEKFIKEYHAKFCGGESAEMVP